MFFKVICKFFLICFKVYVSKISDNCDKFLLNCSNLFWSSFFSGHNVDRCSCCSFLDSDVSLSI